MANPRKFSEKIALHHQKQAEGTAAFEQIIREVSDATNKPEDATQVINMVGYASRGSVGGGTSPSSMGASGMVTSTARAQHRGRSTATSSSVGPMRARPADRKHDTSPYGSSVYLSPPPDTSWRRTNSDSALHQSSSLTAQPTSPHHHPHYHHNNTLSAYTFHNQSGPNLQQHHSHSQQSLHMSHHQHNAQAQQDHSHRRVADNNLESMIAMINANQNRPRSSCEMPRVPGINVYPSQDMSSMNASLFDAASMLSSGVSQSNNSSVSNNGPQLTVPASAGTGSLPDLTSVHYHSLAHHSPHSPHNVDTTYVDDHSSSPYSSSPISASPATLSPTQLPPSRQPSARSYGPPSPGAGGGGGIGGGPTLSSPYSPTNQNHLSVPYSNRYLQQNKGISLEQGWIQAGYQQQCSPPSLHSSHSNINIPSPTMGVPPSQICGSPNSRSPAGGSPGPGDSPQAQSQSQQDSASNDAYYISHALQQHFEQFSMMDTPVSNLNYVNNGSPNQSHYSQSPLREVSTGGGGDPGGGNCNSAPGGALFGARAPCPSGNSCPGCARCLAPNTPNTPTSIPDIILTDFSSTGCGGCGSCALSVGDALSKELLCSGATDGLFADEDGLRDGLDPIDLDGLQMLTDPDMNVVSDPSTEDAFRLDRL